MNTSLEYQYRDALDVRFDGVVIFAGPPEPELVGRLFAAIENREYFIAEQVRIPEVFPWFPGPHSPKLSPYQDQIDHPWHRVLSVGESLARPTDSRAFTVFVRELEVARRLGWNAVIDTVRATSYVSDATL